MKSRRSAGAERAALMPQRQSLPSQVAAILLRRLSAGEWREAIPSERRLCEELRVSRKTIRAALEGLHRQGLLKSAGHRRRAIAFPSSPRAGFMESMKIVLLGSTPLLRVQQPITVALEDLQANLHKSGFDLEISISPRFGLHGSKVLEDLVRRTPSACWILWSLQPETQRWFASRGLPVVVFGSCMTGILLPSVDVDYNNSIQHAVDLLVAKGHRRIAYLSEKSELAGFRLSEEKFVTSFQRHTSRGAEGRIVHQDNTVEGTVKTLDKVLAGNRVPTALVVSDPMHALTVLGDLARRGLQVPADLSVVTIGNDPCLEFVIPRMARYTYDPSQLARKLAAVAAQLARSEPSRVRSYRVPMRFVAGDSVSAPSVR